ncbi:MAG: hypothetical protein HZB92_05710 [Euryarchaeota archaeon]|nr:hypothetical protein [Euryarchaeota archaeon]
MKRLRLMFLTPYYPPIFTACGNRIFEMVRYLRKSDEVESIDVVLWNPQFSFDEKEIPQMPKVRVHCISFRRALPRIVFEHQDPNPLYAFMWMALAYRYISKINPTMVYITTPPGVMSASAISCIVRKRQYVVEYRDDWMSRNRLAISRLNGLMKYGAFFFNSIFSKIAGAAQKRAAFTVVVHDEIGKKLSRPMDVITVPNGIDVEEIVKLNKAGQSGDRRPRMDSKTIAYVGQLGLPYLKPEAILPAIAKLKGNHPGLRYHIFSTRLDAHFEKEVERLGIGSSIAILSLSHMELLSRLKEATFGLVPLDSSDPETRYVYPSKMYDYIAASLPILVIANEGSAIFKLVKENGNGKAMTWEMTDDIPRAIDELLSDPIYLEKAEKALPHFLELYNREDHLRQLIEKLSIMTNRLRPLD